MTVDAISDSIRKKQLGQYFTDHRVGRLLAALADANSAKTIIDPMVGSANLLQSCLSLGTQPNRIVGIELDPIALHLAETALSEVESAELILGDAFSTPLPSHQFDLVITNPPYIRYQSKGDLEGVKVPTSTNVRSGLVQAIEARSEFSAEDRAAWLQAATEYPGTSDIAVPAWILSAALVREGGILAVVAPKAWLSRNYAHAVRNLIEAAFEIDFIVEDGDASWFRDAQVRTQLVVARRRPVTRQRKNSQTVVARATKELVNGDRLRGALDNEEAVVSALRSVTTTKPSTVTTGLTARLERNLSTTVSPRTVRVPQEIAAVLNAAEVEANFRALHSYGWRAGQGLRSGANDFFYVREDQGLVLPAPRWGLGPLELPSECLLLSVRRQADLGDEFTVVGARLKSRLVNLDGWVTSTDLKKMEASEAKILPESVRRWIDQVANTPFSQKEPSKLFPDLSAVTTNSRFDRSGRPTRFWYQLPPLAPRHQPELLIGRVCGDRPKTYLNRYETVVDANFSGLWSVGAGALPPEAMLALMNSCWIWANLELACTVLGGGALKVEATDLRRLPMPDFCALEIDRLTQLGEWLATKPSDATLTAIDKVVVGSVVPKPLATEIAAELRSIAQQAMDFRAQTAKRTNP